MSAGNFVQNEIFFRKKTEKWAPTDAAEACSPRQELEFSFIVIYILVVEYTIIFWIFFVEFS